jgi:UDP-N-acetylglucosamine--N-acetylmuramyl-(pentapeptide) pyrophosphoryl-undecaprenol N-acetylglucosamine transferase
MSAHHPEVRIQTVSAGKFRRYHGMSLLQHVLTPSIIFPNIRDLGRIVVGFVQAFVRLILWRPDVVFTKGGYVCLPVGYAAWLLRIPLVIHDSDAHPGLTNRLLAPCARAIATGSPLKYYSYPPEKSTYVGIPISPDFYPRTTIEKRAEKSKLGLDPELPLIVVTGGGLGARRVNEAVLKILPDLADTAAVLLITGAGEYEHVQKVAPQNSTRLRIVPFISSGMADILGSADIVVSRAGATALLELAASHAATILVPNSQLTGGHQLKNAKVYSDEQAAVIVSDSDDEAYPDELAQAIHGLLEDSSARHTLSSKIALFAKPHAARDVARLIIRASIQKR